MSKPLKILFITFIVFVFVFKGLPLIKDFGKYSLQKKFDQSQIVSIAKSHNYNGIILERMSSYGIGEIYLLQVDGTEKSIAKAPLK